MLGFLMAIAGGALTPILEGPVARPVARSLANNIELADGELRVFSFMIIMIAVGLLCALLSTGSPLGLAIGGTLGYFGGRLTRWFRRSIEAKRS